MYRIISGQWKAKRISAPKNFTVRPTTDFAKEALFSILENRFDVDFASAAALDLFAGIGSLSLELASRGCQDVTSVELNPKHAAFITTTAEQLDMHNQVQVQRGDVFDWLKKNKGRRTFSLILADPPFSLEEAEYQQLINSLLKPGEFLTENGVLVVEHQSRKIPAHPALLDTRKYGNVSFSFFRAEAAPAEELQDTL